jgi:UDP-N-acetylmuramoyl-tripeptide--D-alanyl-D-alanine ligase
VKGRLQFKVARNGAWIIDDSYNANPSSVKAGIDVLAGLDGRKWLVIGDMAELGDFAESSHAEIGTYAREHGIERMFATGSLTGLSVEKFGNGGQWFTDTQALAKALDEAAGPDVRMLIKGSRVNRLERVIEALVAGASHAGKTG